MIDRRSRWLTIFSAVLIGLVWWSLGGRDVAPVERASSPASAPAAPVTPERSLEEAYDLERDEARGGHTLARHVGRTDAELAARLDREKGISAASTYTDRGAAERTIARTLASSRDRIDRWVERGERRPNLALDYRGRQGEVIGRTLRRGRPSPDPSIDAVVVLRANGPSYFVLTSYPELRR